MAVKLELRIIDALARTESDWRTVPSLSRQLEVEESKIKKTLDSMADIVRRPVGYKRHPEEESYYRLVNRGYTWQEKLRIALAIMARNPHY